MASAKDACLEGAERKSKRREGKKKKDENRRMKSMFVLFVCLHSFLLSFISQCAGLSYAQLSLFRANKIYLIKALYVHFYLHANL